MSKHISSQINELVNRLTIPVLKPRNPIARDLLTSKYRMRTVERKDVYKRKHKHVKPVDFCY